MDRYKCFCIFVLLRLWIQTDQNCTRMYCKVLNRLADGELGTKGVPEFDKTSLKCKERGVFENHLRKTMNTNSIVQHAKWLPFSSITEESLHFCVAEQFFRVLLLGCLFNDVKMPFCGKCNQFGFSSKA